MTVYLKMNCDGITIYENVSYTNNLLNHITQIIHDIYNNSNEVNITLEIFYDKNMITIDLNSQKQSGSSS